MDERTWTTARGGYDRTGVRGAPILPRRLSAPATGERPSRRSRLALEHAHEGSAAACWAWRARLLGTVRGDPTLDGGILYAGTEGGILYAFHVADRRFLWKRRVRGGVDSSPAVWRDLVLVGSGGGAFYGVHRTTGEVAWTAAVPGRVYATPALWGDRVLVGSRGGSVACLEAATGNVVWKTRVAPSNLGPVTSLAVRSGRVLYATMTGKVGALDAASGATLWTHELPQRNASSPTVDEHFVFARGGDLLKLDAADGREAWTHPLGDDAYGGDNPCVVNEGCLVLAQEKGVFGIDGASGLLLWTFKLSGRARRGLALAQGNVLVPSSSHEGAFIHCLDAGTGVPKWHLPMEAAPLAPLVDGDAVYALTEGGWLYAAEWPTPRHAPMDQVAVAAAPPTVEVGTVRASEPPPRKPPMSAALAGELARLIPRNAVPEGGGSRLDRLLAIVEARDRMTSPRAAMVAVESATRKDAPRIVKSLLVLANAPGDAGGRAHYALRRLHDVAPEAVEDALDGMWRSKSRSHRYAAFYLVRCGAARGALRHHLGRALEALRGFDAGGQARMLLHHPFVAQWPKPTRDEVEALAEFLLRVGNDPELAERTQRAVQKLARELAADLHRQGASFRVVEPLVRDFVLDPKPLLTSEKPPFQDWARFLVDLRAHAAALVALQRGLDAVQEAKESSRVEPSYLLHEELQLLHLVADARAARGEQTAAVAAAREALACAKALVKDGKETPGFGLAMSAREDVLRRCEEKLEELGA